MLTTEHRSMKKRCRCGTLNAGTFPREATAPTCYGPNVRAAALYLLFGQFLSVERTAEAMSAMLGAEVSTGFVASLASEAALGLGGFNDEVVRRLRSSALVHADETSDQVRTDKWWFHVVSNERYTHLFASPTRGKDAPDEAGVLGDFEGVMVHDRLAMYFKYDHATHAICLAHVLRELEPIGVRWDQGWANDMAALLKEMNNAAHDARDRGTARWQRSSSRPSSSATTPSWRTGSRRIRNRRTVAATTSNASRSTSSPPSTPSSPRPPVSPPICACR